MPPETNFQSFLLLGSHGVFQERYAKELAASAGLRNKLVHEYEKIDPYILYKSLQRFYPLYVRYRKEIYRWVEKQK